MTDFENTQPFTYSEFARELTKRWDRPVHPQTVRRWCEQGVVNRNTNERVFMDSRRMPWGMVTNMTAYRLFIDALNDGQKNGEKTP